MEYCTGCREKNMLPFTLPHLLLPDPYGRAASWDKAVVSRAIRDLRRWLGMVPRQRTCLCIYGNSPRPFHSPQSSPEGPLHASPWAINAGALAWSKWWKDEKK